MTDIMLKLTNDEAKVVCLELEAVINSDFPEPDPESEWYDEVEHTEWTQIKAVYDRLREQVTW